MNIRSVSNLCRRWVFVGTRGCLYTWTSSKIIHYEWIKIYISRIINFLRQIDNSACSQKFSFSNLPGYPGQSSCDSLKKTRSVLSATGTELCYRSLSVTRAANNSNFIETFYNLYSNSFGRFVYTHTFHLNFCFLNSSFNKIHFQNLIQTEIL